MGVKNTYASSCPTTNYWCTNTPPLIHCYADNGSGGEHYDTGIPHLETRASAPHTLQCIGDQVPLYVPGVPSVVEQEVDPTRDPPQSASREQARGAMLLEWYILFLLTWKYVLGCLYYAVMHVYMLLHFRGPKIKIALNASFYFCF